MSQGIFLSKPKMCLVQSKIRYLRHDIESGFIRPIQRVIEFSNKFLDVLSDKTQLQRFLGSLNYIAHKILQKIASCCGKD